MAKKPKHKEEAETLGAGEKFVLSAPCEAILEIKKSLFLAYAAPVVDEAFAMAFFEAHAKEDASHNCWAFRAGGAVRAFDAGEPGGTAGRPILSVIEGRDLEDIAVLVIRYFGGIKLGAGGLVRAYSGAAAACLNEGVYEIFIPMQKASLTCPFDLFDFFSASLEKWGGKIENREFGGQGVRLDVTLPIKIFEEAQAWLSDHSRGQVRFETEKEEI
ncbi:YigZ family protein [Acetobacteraceae bacterium]|nr:YigZ family protein [Acetobacteraceae bacterium]